MKLLTVVRHAKSSWGDASLPDHDRPLNSRGRRVAPLMGELLASRIKAPDLTLSSTALRARTTAGIIAAKLGCPDQDRVSIPSISGHGIQTVVHAVYEIDVSDPSWLVKDFVAWCPTPLPTMAGTVARTEIGLGLDNPHHQAAVLEPPNQKPAQQIGGDLVRRATVELQG